MEAAEFLIEIDKASGEISQSVINSYVAKVKKETGQDLSISHSKGDIAEQLIKFLIDEHGTVENIPTYALIGGSEEMVEDVEDVALEPDETEMDTTGEDIPDEDIPVEDIDPEMDSEDTIDDINDTLDDADNDEFEAAIEDEIPDVDEDIPADEDTQIEEEETEEEEEEEAEDISNEEEDNEDLPI